MSKGAVRFVCSATVPPPPLVEEVVVAAMGDSHIRLRKRVETACTRGGWIHVMRGLMMARAIGDGRRIRTDQAPAQNSMRLWFRSRCLRSAAAL